MSWEEAGPPSAEGRALQACSARELNSVWKGQEDCGQKCAQCNTIKKGSEHKMHHTCVGCWLQARSDPHVPLVDTRGRKAFPQERTQSWGGYAQKPRK